MVLLPRPGLKIYFLTKHFKITHGARHQFSTWIIQESLSPLREEAKNIPVFLKSLPDGNQGSGSSGMSRCESNHVNKSLNILINTLKCQLEGSETVNSFQAEVRKQRERSSRLPETFSIHYLRDPFSTYGVSCTSGLHVGKQEAGGIQFGINS